MKRVTLKTNQNNPVIRAYKDAVERGRKNQHVLPRASGWIVKRAGSERASKIFSTQTKATEYAKSVAQTQGTSVFVHGSDGRIRDRRDY
jgi:hypothetical protein